MRDNTINCITSLEKKILKKETMVVFSPANVSGSDCCTPAHEHCDGVIHHTDSQLQEFSCSGTPRPFKCSSLTSPVGNNIKT